MKYQESGIGRVFIIRLENEDRLPDAIERFAQAKGVRSALVFFLGGAAGTSKVVVGPQDAAAKPIIPMLLQLSGTSEAVGVGTVFSNENGLAKLHMHASFGRGDQTVTGCTREGVDIWHVGEVIILELTNNTAQRKVEPNTGFELLEL